MVHISVIIPAHNEEKYIERCIKSIKKSAKQFRGKVEIIVVCNRCTDRTAEIAKSNGANVVFNEDRCIAKVILHSGWKFWFDSEVKPLRKEAERLVSRRIVLGKQINYWMDYENFILLAEKALELGCIIYRRRADEQGKIVYGNDISIVTANVSDYYFYFPQAGKIVIDIINGRECISTIHESGQAIIEAGFSIIHQEKKKITRSRLWCSSGFYREDGEYINRSEDLTKVYNSLARYVKKLAPYTELVDVYISSRDKDYGKEVEYKHKEYVSRYCIDKMSEGYKLV